MWRTPSRGAGELSTLTWEKMLHVGEVGAVATLTREKLLREGEGAVAKFTWEKLLRGGGGGAAAVKAWETGRQERMLEGKALVMDLVEKGSDQTKYDQTNLDQANLAKQLAEIAELARQLAQGSLRTMVERQ